MLKRSDLWSLEEYAEKRIAFREEVLAHKTARRVQLGANMLLVFEDEKTIRYQIQEMLRIEKVFEAEGIQEELDAYNPLIPDGDNLKCSLLIQYPDVDERRRWLADLVGVEHKVWLQVGDCDKVYAIADEDLERSTEDKTSAVHFLRFQLTSQMIEQAKQVGALTFGVDHDAYPCDDHETSEAVRDALLADLR